MQQKTNNQELTLEEKWEQAGLENGFIFYKVMRDHPDACKRLLEILLHIQITKIEMKEEESIMIDNGAKSIRLDIYLKNDTHVFDIELQVANTGELPERSRYYTGLMDVDTLKTGEFYLELKTSHVIFICIDDIFSQELPVYTFENICNEDNTIKLNDRTYKHFFIAKNCDKIVNDEEQKAFLNLLISKKATTDYTKTLEHYIRIAKKNSQWRHTYMECERQRAYDRREGSQSKAIEIARNFIKMDFSLDKIAEGTGLTLEQVLQIKESILVSK